MWDHVQPTVSNQETVVLYSEPPLPRLFPLRPLSSRATPLTWLWSPPRRSMQSIPLACYSVSTLPTPTQASTPSKYSFSTARAPSLSRLLPLFSSFLKGQGKSCRLLEAKCLPPFSRPAFLLGCEFAAGQQLLKGKDGSSSPTHVAV